MSCASGTGPTAGPRPHDTATNGESHATAYVAALRRRRAASWRLPPLADGHRDPWRYRQPAPSPAALLAWAVTIDHFADLGHDVRWAVPVEVLQELAVAA